MIRSINNGIYIRRRRKICLPPQTGAETLPAEYIATLLKNLESLGFTFGEELIEACFTLSVDGLVALYEELIPLLRAMRGAHREFKPMYPGFPQQVMEMDRCQLYLNSILHYLTAGAYFPPEERKPRFPLLENVTLTVIHRGTEEEFARFFGQIAKSNTSLSIQDKDDLAWFIQHGGMRGEEHLPKTIPQKENMATIMGLLVTHAGAGAELLGRYCRTATDVLRIAVALSDGDVSLAQPTRFRAFSRKERRLLLALLEQAPNITEDMLRWKERWVRLGERLHPGEFRARYPRSAEAFDILRNDLPFLTFNGRVERALTAGSIRDAITVLKLRPGELARRLDHLLRLDAESGELILATFASVAASAATPLLLQLREHFKRRGEEADRATKALRVFFPKGEVARAWATENRLPHIPENMSAGVVEICEQALLDRFAALAPLGRCYLDEKLADYMVPFSQRSASRSFRTVVRGSRLPLPEPCNVLRFFIWWKNGRYRTDIDLSAALFDEDFIYKDVVSYYNLSTYGGCHSGDIVDAPNGASEFIDIMPEKVLAAGARYVVMAVNSFTYQPFCELPECFAGWMARAEPQSGEIYEPKTVRDRLDVTANASITIPLIIDMAEREVIWCDMALEHRPQWANSVHANKGGIGVTLRAMADLGKPNLYDLLALHIAARGERVESPELADIVFSVEAETPFHLEKIAAEFLQ